MPKTKSWLFHKIYKSLSRAASPCGWGRGQTENYWLEVSHMIWSPYQVYPDLWSPTPSLWAPYWVLLLLNRMIMHLLWILTDFHHYQMIVLASKWTTKVIMHDHAHWFAGQVAADRQPFSKVAERKSIFLKGGMRKHILLLSVWLQKISLACVPKTSFFCTCLRIHVSLCPSNKIKSITPLSAQISASKFQNLSQIPLKIRGVWKNRGVWLKILLKYSGVT